ncbi:lipocalin family protein [Rufibacter sp. LB8]|uniref:lipocalin family protein n=1 Tax=Rufibacter sp. LB8 TaxID=2777781 RepID=UPI00178C7CBD|nr:lipocalin family protein [Rufibacter sp. LB8]
MKKNYLFLLLTAFALVFSACGDDDDDEDDDVKTSNIEGRWQMTAFTLSVGTNTADMLEGEDVIFEFKNGKATIYNEGVPDDPAPYTISGDKITIKPTDGSPAQTWTIDSVSSTSLKLSFIVSGGGQTGTYRMTFRKL